MAADHPLGIARGQIANTYIVAEAADGLVIVDQHAAHERLVLEAMRGRAGHRRTGARWRTPPAGYALLIFGWRSHYLNAIKYIAIKHYD